MPYQGSAQSIGFKQRVAPDSSKRMRRVAQDLEKQTVDQVNSMQRQASGQMQEMRRIDSVLSQKDEYDLQKLRQFSSSLNEAMKTTAETVGKEYIAQKRQQYIEEEEAAYNGDPEAIKKVSLKDDQVADIEARVEAQRKKTEELGIKFDESKFKLSLEQKYRVLNAQKQGGNKAWGWTRGYLQRAEKGFLPWYDDKKNSDNREVEYRGRKFVINSTDLNAEDTLARDAFLKSEYIAQHGGGLNQNVVRKYLTKGVTETLAKQQNQDYQYAKRQQAFQAREDQKLKILGSLEGIDTAEGKQNFVNEYQVLLDNGYRWARQNGSSNPGKDAREYAQNVLKEHFSTLKKGSHANIDDMEDALEAIESTEFSIPGLGKKKLSEHWGLKIEDLRADAIHLNGLRFAKEQEGLKKSFESEVQAWKEANSHLKEDDLAEARDEFIAKLGQSYDGWTGLDAALGTLAKYDGGFVISDDAADKEAAFYRGKGIPIPPEKAMKYSPEKREQYKNEIGPRIFQSPLQQSLYTGALATIDTELENVSNKIDERRLKDKNDLVLAKQHVRDNFVQKFKEIKLDDDRLSDEQAIEETKKWFLREIANDQTNSKDATGTFRVIPGEGFETFLNRPETQKSRNLDNGLKSQALNTLDQLTMASNEDIFTTTNLVTNPRDLEIVNGKPHRYFKQLALRDPKNRTTYQLLNLQRKANDLEPIDWSKVEIQKDGQKMTVQDIIDIHNKANPQIQADLASGDSTRQSRAVDRLGLVDGKTLHNALISSNIEVNPAELDEHLEAAGMTREEYNTPEGKIKLTQHRVNYLMKVAATKTDNKDIMIRMVAVGITGDEHSMLNAWNNPDANGKRSLAVLQNYYSGSNHLPKEYKTTTQASETGIEEDESNMSQQERFESRQVKLKAKMQEEEGEDYKYRTLSNEIVRLKAEARKIRKEKGLSYAEYMDVLIGLYDKRLGGLQQ